MLQPRRLKRIVPVLVICGLAYIDYAACFVIGYKQLFHKGLKAAAIALWVVLALLEGSVFLYWFLLLFRGPTKCHVLKPFDIHDTKDPSLLQLPYAFACDKQGYPFWCGKCKSIKPARLFHLNDMDYCCARFDHYCIWVGTAIGRDNQIPFIKFVQFFDAFFIFILAYVALTTRQAFRESSESIAHYIILYVVSVFWIIMTLALLAMQIVYIRKNWTTLDELTINQARKYAHWDRRMRKRNYNPGFCSPAPPRIEDGHRYINVLHKGRRLVVQYSVKDLAFSQGFMKNLINLVLNGNVNVDLLQSRRIHQDFFKALIVLLVPYIDIFICTPPQKTLEYSSFSDTFSPEFLAQIDRKIEHGNCEVPLYAPAFEPLN